jgi:hypothetical protein
MSTPRSAVVMGCRVWYMRLTASALARHRSAIMALTCDFPTSSSIVQTIVHTHAGPLIPTSQIPIISNDKEIAIPNRPYISGSSRRFTIACILTRIFRLPCLVPWFHTCPCDKLPKVCIHLGQFLVVMNVLFLSDVRKCSVLMYE